MRRLAVADLGSNSFRLVVFAADGAWFRRVDEIHEVVRIGAGLGATGELAAERVERALAVVEVFAHFCDASGIARSDVMAVATSAIRDARNRDAFTSRSAVPVRVLSAQEEARYGYLAAVNSTTLAGGAVLDVGGGSVQLVEVRERIAGDCGSWPLGAVRMTKRFLSGGGPARAEQLDALRAHARETLLRDAAWLEGAPRLVALGGTVRNLAAATQAAAGRPSIGVQGAVVGRDELGALAERLAALAPGERGGVRGIKPGRADVILGGAAVVEAVMDAAGIDRLEVTEAGLREGVFFAWLLASRDPPLLEDVRRASVESLAAQHGRGGEHDRHVAALALGLYDDLAAHGVQRADPWERELLWAAAMLHDAGMDVDYDDHHRHSRYLVLNAGLPGFTQREVALVAELVRYHRKGTPSFGSDLAPLARDGDLDVLRRGATLLRLAEGAERSRDQAVRALRVEDGRGDGAVRLVLDVVGDEPVARWAAARERPLFRRAFGRDLEIA